MQGTISLNTQAAPASSNKKITDVDAVVRCMNLLREVEVLKLDIKAVLDEAKDAGHNVKLIRKVANLLVKEKDYEFVQESKDAIELLDRAIE